MVWIISKCVTYMIVCFWTICENELMRRVIFKKLSELIAVDIAVYTLFWKFSEWQIYWWFKVQLWMIDLKCMVKYVLVAWDRRLKSLNEGKVIKCCGISWYGNSSIWKFVWRICDSALHGLSRYIISTVVEWWFRVGEVLKTPTASLKFVWDRFEFKEIGQQLLIL